MEIDGGGKEGGMDERRERGEVLGGLLTSSG